MSDNFNPYHKWLGIPLHQQPANYYRLLGLEQGECDPDVIAHAAEQRMLHLKSVQTGKRGHLSQQLLNEILEARICLLNSEKKIEYDNQLLSQQQGIPLEINIDTRTKREERNTASHSTETDEKRWKGLEMVENNPPKSADDIPDFSNVVATEDNQDLEILDTSFDTQEVSSETEKENHSGVNHPTPPPIPPNTPEPPPHSSMVRTSGSSFPLPPPLPNRVSTHVPTQQLEGPLPPQLSGDTSDSGSITLPQIHQSSEDDSLMGPDRGVTHPDYRTEIVGGDLFSPLGKEGVAQKKKLSQPSNRKKENQIRLVGHIVAPIIGLILGWIILQFLLTK